MNIEYIRSPGAPGPRPEPREIRRRIVAARAERARFLRGLGSHLVARLGLWWDVSRTERALSRLGDRELEDLALTRAQLREGILGRIYDDLYGKPAR